MTVFSMARGGGDIKGTVVGFTKAGFASVVGTLMRQPQIGDEIQIGLLFTLSLVLLLAGGIRHRQKGKSRSLVVAVTIAGALLCLVKTA